MDHIPVPHDTLSDNVRVPYLGSDNTAYDGLGLYAFTRRKEFDLNGFAKGEFGTWSPSEAFALVQSFAFFGLLIETFKNVGIITRIDDFVS